MPDLTGGGEIDQERPRGESELTAALITAATNTSGPLSQEEVDRILGVRPEPPER